MRVRIFVKLVALLFSLVLFQNKAFPQEWYMPLGLAFQDGNSELVNYYERGTDVLLSSPFGINFQPYYNYSFGLRIGFGLGPVGLILGDEFADSYIDLPVNFNLGYTILPKFNYSPYVKTAIVYRLAAAENIESRVPGLLIAMGMELFRKRAVGLGIEIGYDFSEIKFKYEDYYWDEYYWDERWEKFTKTIRPGQFLFSVFAIF